MSLALLCQAEITNDMLNADISDGAMWCTFNEYCTTHIRQDVRNNLQTNKSMRQGFSNMFDHVAKCLRAKQVPDGPNVLQMMRNYSEWPPVTKNFLKGVVEFRTLLMRYLTTPWTRMRRLEMETSWRLSGIKLGN